MPALNPERHYLSTANFTADNADNDQKVKSLEKNDQLANRQAEIILVH